MCNEETIRLATEEDLKHEPLDGLGNDFTNKLEEACYNTTFSEFKEHVAATTGYTKS